MWGFFLDVKFFYIYLLGGGCWLFFIVLGELFCFGFGFGLVLVLGDHTWLESLVLSPELIRRKLLNVFTTMTVKGIYCVFFINCHI